MFLFLKQNLEKCLYVKRSALAGDAVSIKERHCVLLEGVCERQHVSARDGVDRRESEGICGARRAWMGATAAVDSTGVGYKDGVGKACKN